MERAAAEPLADILIGPSHEGYADADRQIRSCADFLAEYHRWAGVLPPRREPYKFLAAQLADGLGHLGVAGPARALAEQAFLELAPPELPLVRKKDAHPENWLVTRDGRVVMIDLESSRPLPVLFEIAQLLDDYPAYRFDDTGWSARMALADRYWRLCIGGECEAETIFRAYSAFVAHRCIVGAARVRSNARKTSSSSALNAMRLRYAHYCAAAAFLANSSSPPVRKLGASIAPAVM